MTEGVTGPTGRSSHAVDQWWARGSGEKTADPRVQVAIRHTGTTAPPRRVVRECQRRRRLALRETVIGHSCAVAQDARSVSVASGREQRASGNARAVGYLRRRGCGCPPQPVVRAPTHRRARVRLPSGSHDQTTPSRQGGRHVHTTRATSPHCVDGMLPGAGAGCHFVSVTFAGG